MPLTYDQYVQSVLENSVMNKSQNNLYAKTIKNMLKASVSIEKNKVVIDNNTIVQTLVSIVDILFVQQRVHEEEQNKLINAGNEQNSIVTNIYQQQQRDLIGLFSRTEFSPNLDDNTLKQLASFEIFILNLQNSYKQLCTTKKNTNKQYICQTSKIISQMKKRRSKMHQQLNSEISFKLHSYNNLN
ncbi:Hypothetical_protein [Hexamita inflata]|uniref:Hypothetical_protein n=1 Tax=Hexamita inflata TaxID=28002 RepID=A0AA86TYD1_9EUKA|nr:Hypothetical protein HINF_LOCUS20716 [Hexamita inflata]